MKLHDLPTGLVTGGYILHSGLDKWRADDAARDSGPRNGGRDVSGVEIRAPGPDFTRLLAASEIAMGAALLAPVVPAAISGGHPHRVLGRAPGSLHPRPGLRKPGSVWPTHRASASARTSWNLGISTGPPRGSCGTRREGAESANTGGDDGNDGGHPDRAAPSGAVDGRGRGRDGTVLGDVADVRVHRAARPPSLDQLRERYRRLVVGHSADGSQQWLNWVVRLAADDVSGRG